MSDGTIRWSEHGSFSVVPEWVLDADVSDRAVRLYAILGRYADGSGQAMPSRKTLAKRLRCSLKSIDRALLELRGIGAVTWTPRARPNGSQTSNDYVMHPTPSSPVTSPPWSPVTTPEREPTSNETRPPDTEPFRRLRAEAGPAPKNRNIPDEVRQAVRRLVAEIDDRDADTENVLLHKYGTTLAARDFDDTLEQLLDRRDLDDWAEEHDELEKIEPIRSEAGWVHTVLQNRAAGKTT